MNCKRSAIVSYAFAAGLLAAAQQVQAQTSPADFYTGKDVRILIGAGVGGTYGLYSQLAARHLRKHIPGQPNLIMQAMPGAGGNVALNYSYNVAPKDGTMMHLVHAEVLFETLMTKGVRFNVKDYGFIGRLSDADAVVIMTKASNIRSLADAKSRESTLGNTGRANIMALAPLMLNRLNGTKFKIIAGYKGMADVGLAMSRGEVEGAGMTMANVLTSHADKLKSGEIVPVLAIASKRLALLPEVPAMTEFGSAGDKLLMEIYASTATIGRALAFPPGVPADRLALMRAAFDKMIVDADFLAEVKKANIPIAPMSGADLTAYVDGVMKTPAAQVEAARELHQQLLTGK